MTTLEELMKRAAMVFHAPWEARTFAIALSLCQSGCYEWEEFRRLLIAEIAADSARPATDDEYYRQFLRALEKLLARARLVAAAEVTQRIRHLKSA